MADDDLAPPDEKLTAGDLAGGGWFASLLRRSLETYARTVDAAYFTRKYPNLPCDAIADRRISLAQRYAALAGGSSALAYTLAVSATLGTAGGASPIGVPAAFATFVADMFFVTRLQLRLAHDLSVIYEHPMSLDDPEDLYDLLRVSFGVKAGEVVNTAAAKLAPEATRVAVKAAASGARLAALKRLPVIGAYLLRRNLIKFAIPLIGVPLTMGINYVSTGSVGRTARRIFRGRAALRERANQLAPHHELAPVLMRVVLLVTRADGHTSQGEADFAQALAHAWKQAGASQLAPIAQLVHLDEAALLSEVEALPPEQRAIVWDTAIASAAVDARVDRRELTILKRLAPACGTRLDMAAVGAETRRYG